MTFSTDPAKPGILTTEFLTTVLGGIASYLIAQGVPAQTSNNIINDFIAIYKGGVALIAIVLIVRQYINSRTAIKQTLLENSTQQKAN